MNQSLPVDYPRARSGFLAAAAEAGARIETFVHPSNGPDGGELAVDLAWIGESASNSNLIVVVSGTHGVEGFAGSAIQARHLAGGVAAGRSTTVVMVHALNPYGFAWVRRTNEDNIDLNRNFIDFAAVPANDRYSEIADIVVPPRWDEATQQSTLSALLAIMEEKGMAEVQEIISGGQYEHPLGLFYGGTEPSWANRLLAELCAGPFSGFDRVAIIDLHTGLGPWGVGELISSVPPDSEQFRSDSAVFGDDLVSLMSPDSVSAQLAGEWISAACEWLAPAQVHAVAIEYGVVDIVSVLMALRADAWLHGYSDPMGPEAVSVKTDLRAAFVDDSPEWVEAIWKRYDQVFGRVAHAFG